MAAPQKNKVDYFPHPTTHGKKMSYLEKKYGNDGYATWFKILEELGNTDYHYLDLSDDVQVMFLSDRCLISEEMLINVINDLIRLKEFDKILWQSNKILFNEKFVESVKDAYKKRNNECVTKNSLLLLLSSLGILKLDKSTLNGIVNPEKAPVNPQTKLKETKEEKTRDKNTRAMDILKSEKQSELDVLWMQNKKQIPDAVKLVETFNNKMDLLLAKGDIEFEANQMMPLFRNYVISWVSNEVKAKEDSKDTATNKPNYF